MYMHIHTRNNLFEQLSVCVYTCIPVYTHKDTHVLRNSACCSHDCWDIISHRIDLASCRAVFSAFFTALVAFFSSLFS